MAPKYPGAVWKPTGGNGDPCRPRAASWHEAVTTAEVSVYGWNQTAAACHGFIGRYGDAEQYVDFYEAVNGVAAGNGEVLTWETWDGLIPATNRSPDGSFGPNDRRWTDEQAERIVDIIAWQVGALGIPARWMESTRERGNAPHRLGVPSAGGAVKINYGPDKWTKWAGKECPGDQRVKQLRDEIIPAAAILAPLLASGRASTLPPGRVNVAAARARYLGGAPVGRSAAVWLRLFAAAAAAGR